MERATSIATADLCDAFPELTPLPPIWRSVGGVVRFAGPVATIRVHDDNALIRATLETNGEGRVLVIDNGGSLACALVGDRLAQLAIDHGWSGVLVYGCVRDSATLREMPLGILTLATMPKPPSRQGGGETQVTVRIGGVDILPGQWLYADEDGAVIAPRQLSLP